MTYCPACGHETGAGRFCTSCGRPIDGAGDDSRTDTAERPAVRVDPEPPAHAQPPTPTASAPPDYSGRFPLFADEVPAAPSTTGTHAAASPGTSETTVLPWTTPDEPRPRPAWLLLGSVGLAFALAVALGFWFLGSSDDKDASGTSTTSAGKETGKPTQGGKASGPKASAPANPSNLASTATAKAPATAPPNLDLSGDVVRYDAANMLDGVASTAWRMPGDGTGRTLKFTLPSESVLTKIGLVNGYAKVDRDRKGHPISWYQRNRRVTEVEWAFDDGTVVTQSLDQTRRMQAMAIDPVRTTTVKLTLVSVSDPGSRNGRNYTPISDVALIGG